MNDGLVDGNGAKILDGVLAYLRRFVVYPSEHAAIAHALWIAHTHRMDAWESTPRIAFLSPEPGSGKSRALEISETLVPNPVQAINVSPAFLFRKISDKAGAPTILFDEIDTVFGPKARENEETRAIINAGHRRGAVAGRCVMVPGKAPRLEELPAYCAVAVAGLGDLPDTILSRSVIVQMRRRAPAEIIEPYRPRLHAAQGNGLRSLLELWTGNLTSLGSPWPVMPESVTDRNADCWEPLLAIADAAGGDWPARARVAAVTFVTCSLGDRRSLGIRLLSDIKTAFEDRDAMSTEHIIIDICKLDEAPWADLRGKTITPRVMANLLRPYGVKPKLVRLGTVIARGYAQEDLHDPWLRYLGQSPIGVTDVTESSVGVTEVTATQGRRSPIGTVTDVTSDTADPGLDLEPNDYERASRGE